MQKLLIDKINLSFGEKQVLSNVQFEVNNNEIVALIGPSGCGKSTLLRCINRMHDHNDNARIEGTVHLDGENIYSPQVDPTEIRQRVGMVFQKPNPFPKSVYKNVSFGLGIGKRPQQVDNIVEQSLKDAFLWDEVKDILHKSALSLSGGQQQRLCIARCIATKPEVILMDEPTSALDPNATRKIEDLILRLKEEYTIVIVTHNMQQAARISDKIAMFYLGELVEFSPTKSFFDSPQHELAKKYVSGKFG